MSKKNMRKSNYNSDISLLFAPQEEKHALEIASLLEQRGIRVYIYDLKSLKTKKTELLSFTTEYKARYHKKSDYFIYLLSGIKEYDLLFKEIQIIEPINASTVNVYHKDFNDNLYNEAQLYSPYYLKIVDAILDKTFLNESNSLLETKKSQFYMKSEVLFSDEYQGEFYPRNIKLTFQNASKFPCLLGQPVFSYWLYDDDLGLNLAPNKAGVPISFPMTIPAKSEITIYFEFRYLDTMDKLFKSSIILSCFVYFNNTVRVAESRSLGDTLSFHRESFNNLYDEDEDFDFDEDCD